MAQLKEINTTFGHATGDRILVQAAKFFRDRFADIATLARFGGEEFMLLLPNGDEAALKQTVETISNYLKGLSLTKDGKTYTCNCVCGLALIDRNTASTQSVIATVFGLAKQATEIKKPAPVAEPDKPGAAKTSLDPAVIEIWAARLRTAAREKRIPSHLPTDHQPARRTGRDVRGAAAPHRPKERGHRTRPVHAGGGSRGTHAGD